MGNKHKSNRKNTDSTRIIAGGSINIGNVSGQIAIGENITQVQSIKQAELEDIRKSLLDFQKGIVRLNLPSEDQNIVNGDMIAAIKEASKEKPTLSKIRNRFENVINTLRDAGKTIKDISELYEPAVKVAKWIGLGISSLS